MHPREVDPDMLPWSEQAEQAVLGALLLDNGAWDRVGDLLQERHFYDSNHGHIFSAIGALVLANRPADTFTVLDALEKSGKADAAGGMPYLSQVAMGGASPGHARRYAEVVLERAMMRGLVEAAEQVKTLATKPGIAVADRLDQAQQVLQGLQVSSGRQMPTGMAESVVRLLDRVQNVADGKQVARISTGIPGLDRRIGGGMVGGKQIILAARPSVGKSSLAEQICLNVAMAGHAAAMFSQEMTKDDLTDRAIANLGRIPLDHVISGKLEKDEYGKLTEAVEKLRNVPLFLDDQPALTLHDISAKARMLKRQHNVKVIAIDYLQLCAAGGKDADSRHHQIEHLSRGLKTLSKQLDLTFITLSQLNREVEKRASGKPALSDLKESGAIEEDADIVMLLSRAQEPGTGIQIINCDLPKNRQGRVGAITLGFDGAHQEWHETFQVPEFKTPPRKHYTEDV